MTSRPLLAPLAALLLLVPIALAGSVSIPDAAGDEAFMVGGSATYAKPCADPSVDILDLAVTSDASTITAQLTLNDLSGFSTTCAGQVLANDHATYKVRLMNLTASAGAIVVGVTVPLDVILFTATRDAGGIQGCASAYIGEAFIPPWEDVRTVCIGTFSVSGDTMTWTIPTHGTFLNTDGFARPYDVRGHTVDLQAGAESWILPAQPYGLVDRTPYYQDFVI